MFSLIQISGCIMERFERFVNSGLQRDFSVYNLSPDEVIRIHDKLENMPFSETQHSMAMIWVGNVYENASYADRVIRLRNGEIA